MRPETLDKIVGQEKAKKVVSTIINVSKITNESVPHIFFSASPGCGKTTFARAIAAEIGTKFYSVNCATIRKEVDLFSIIDDMEEREVIFLDEIHALPKKISESLYTILEDFCYFESGYKTEIPKITVIAATTEIGLIPPPLKSRFKFVANLEPYTEEQLVDVCKLVCESKGFKLNKNISAIIAKTCRNIPRIMTNRVEWIYSYMIGNNKKTLTPNEIIEVIKLQGVNEDGLENQDIEYLKVLKKERNCSLNTISSKLRIDQNNVKNIIEPFLFSKGFIEVSPGKGRYLTKLGQNYVSNLEKET